MLVVLAVVLGLPSLGFVLFPREAMHERDAFMAIGSLLVLAAFSVRALAPRMLVNRWGGLGFLGAWFFMILAPSSSVVPIVTEMAAERRIYLPLAAVIVLVLLGVETLRRTIADPAAPHRRHWQLAALTTVAIFYVWVSGWLTHRWLEPYGAPTLHRQIVLFAAEWTVRVAVAAAAAGAISKLGALFVDMGRPRDAIPYLERALAASPTTGDWATYGVALEQSGQHEKALNAFDASLKLDPNQAAARINKAGVLINVGRYADAVRELLAVLALDARSVTACANLALAYVGLGQADHAIRASEDAIRLAPQSTHPR